MRRHGIQQLLGDAIRISVQKPHPQQILVLRKFSQKLREPITQTEVLAVRSRVLPDQRNFSRAGSRQILRPAAHRLESPAAKSSAKLRNKAQCAEMPEALPTFDVRSVVRGRDEPRRHAAIEQLPRLR